MTYDFPNVLYTIPAIAKALSSFYYLHSDIRVMIKINSTPYHAGAMQVSFIHDTTSSTASTIFQRSAMHSVMLNYSTPQSLDMTYTWRCPTMYCLTTTVAGKAPIGTLYLDPLINVRNTSSDLTTITCTVQAMFVNPRTAGFINQPIAQSGEVRNKPIVSDEAIDKSENSSLVSAMGSLNLSPLFESIPVVGDVIRMAKMIMDKPTTTATPMKMIHDMSTDFMHGTGLDQANRLSLYPGTKLATRGVFCEEDMTTNNTFLQIASKPMLHEFQDFTTLGQSLEIGVTPWFASSYLSSTTDLAPDFLMYVTSYFKYWRGSIKYLFYFVTDQFTTARFRISYSILESTTDFLDGGDFPNTVVEVKGTTKFALIVPFFRATAYDLVKAPTTAKEPKLNITMMTAPIAQAGEPMITLMIYRASGPDGQWALPVESNLNTPPVFKRPRAQSNIEQDFKSVFECLTCDDALSVESGYTMSETAQQMSDVMKRYFIRDTIYLNNNWIEQRTVYSDDSDFRVIQKGVAMLFKYQRGSSRYKFLMEATTATWVLISPTTTYNPRSGVVGANTAHQALISVEVPYQSQYPYLGQDGLTYSSMPEYEGGICSVPGAGVQYILSSFADDTQMGYLLYPPTLVAASKRKIIRQDKGDLSSLFEEDHEKDRKGVPQGQGRGQNAFSPTAGGKNSSKKQ